MFGERRSKRSTKKKKALAHLRRKMKIHIHPVYLRPTSHSATSHYKPGDVSAPFIMSDGNGPPPLPHPTPARPLLSASEARGPLRCEGLTSSAAAAGVTPTNAFCAGLSQAEQVPHGLSGVQSFGGARPSHYHPLLHGCLSTSLAIVLCG